MVVVKKGGEESEVKWSDSSGILVAPMNLGSWLTGIGRPLPRFELLHLPEGRHDIDGGM